MQTIYLMGQTDSVEDTSECVTDKEGIIHIAAKWYWGVLSNPNNVELVVNVDFDRLVVEVRDSMSFEITTYYLFAYDRRLQ